MGCGGGCGCAPCGDPARPALVNRALRGDAAARKLLELQGAPAQIGDVLPKIVGPSDVAKLKRDLEPQMNATDQAVRDCTAVDLATRAAWAGFFSRWLAYRDDWDSVLGFGTSSRYDQGIALQGELARWQGVLRGTCNVPGPAVVDPAAQDDRAFSVVKWGAAAVIAVAVVYLAAPLVRK